ncbi:MAG: ribonuclease III [Lachnospiraceae bacterium]|nr:ribonuclease III [Lachnospiraceae bacterium]
MNETESLKALEEKIGYVFSDRELLKRALTHSSYANELQVGSKEDYERYEFLGDAVLELTVSDYLFRKNKGMKEGEMTKIRASYVCEPTLAICARSINLQEHMLLGKGEEAQGSRNRDSIISDVFEAVIGAIYLDGGLSQAKQFIKRFVLKDIDKKRLFFDSKTQLQTITQRAGQELRYEVVGEEGPDHDKSYTVEVIIDGKGVARGKGSSKKHAQQSAAYEALLILNEKEE